MTNIPVTAIDTNRDSTLLFILCKISLGQSSDIQKLISLPAAFLSLTASLVTHSFYSDTFAAIRIGFISDRYTVHRVTAIANR